MGEQPLDERAEMISNTRRRAAGAAAIGMALYLLLGACAGPSGLPNRWPDRFDYNFRWVAGPGVDLETGAAVQLRSAVETAFMGGAGQFSEDELKERQGLNMLSYDPPTLWQLDERAADYRWKVRGTIFAQIRRVEQDGVLGGFESWAVDACVWGGDVAFGNEAGEYFSSRNAAEQPSGEISYFGQKSTERSVHFIEGFAVRRSNVPSPEPRLTGSSRYPVHPLPIVWETLGYPATLNTSRWREQPCEWPAEFPASLNPDRSGYQPGARVPAPEVLPPYPGWP